MLAFTLTAFLELMDHGIVSWDMVSITFIKQVRPPVLSLPSVTSALGLRGDAGHTAILVSVGFLSLRLWPSSERFLLLYSQHLH